MGIISPMSQAIPNETSSVNIHRPDPVTLTDAAAYKVAELIAEEEDFDLKFRAQIKGGGCSGFEYHFKFAHDVLPKDTQIHKSVTLDDGQKVDVTLLIDYRSLMYLAGSTVDYKNDIEGERFLIINPNAKTTCGCGSSFSVE